MVSTPTTVDKSNWKSGNYNAWVVMGETKEIRRERLAEVPELYRAKVEAHVRTQFLIIAESKKRQAER
jgi:hypothetical protein